ncbi:MAG: glycosyltransferase [Thermoanaerobaculia bacterium]|nr:glycosyltransferase [Thermoanaerobaculia bacterium]
MAIDPAVSVVVPTLGTSPYLVGALRSVRRQGEVDLDITVVHQGSQPLPEEARGLYDHLHTSTRRLGFAAANNVGVATTTAPWVLLLNDDAELDEGWITICLDFLAKNPETGAVQGVNLRPGSPATLDGAGIGWSRPGWQAVQLGHGRPSTEAPVEAQEIFGVSATACLMRRAALTEVALKDGELFDPRLDTYYEDVELAVRLRAAGWTSHLLPAATAVHVGGASGRRLGRQRLALLYGNRYLTVARLLGREFAAAKGEMRRRDLRDLLRHPSSALGIAAGWRRVRRELVHFAHEGPANPPREEIRRFEARS